MTWILFILQRESLDLDGICEGFVLTVNVTRYELLDFNAAMPTSNGTLSQRSRTVKILHSSVPLLDERILDNLDIYIVMCLAHLFL